MKLIILFPELYRESKYMGSLEEVLGKKSFNDPNNRLDNQDRIAVITCDILSYYMETRMEHHGYESYFRQLITGKNKAGRITKKSKHLDYHNTLDTYFVTVFKKKGVKGDKPALDYVDRDEWKKKATAVLHVKEFSAEDETIQSLISFLTKFFSEGEVELFIEPEPSKKFEHDEAGQYEMF